MAIPGEPPDTPNGAAPDPNSAPPPWVSGNNEILVWLDVLLKGKPEQQALARTEIAMILEARGHSADAEEAYWTNVQARSTDRRAYERLIALYQTKGDRLSESLVRNQLDEVFRERPAGQHGTGATASHPGGPGTRGTVHRGARPGSTPVQPPVQRVRRLRSARQEGADHAARDDKSAAPPEPSPTVQQPPQPVVEPPPAVTATGPHAAVGHAYAAITTSGQPPTAPSAAPASVPQPVQSAPRAPQPYVDAVPVRRRPSPLSPNPAPGASRGRFTSGGLIAPEPTTIGAFLLASVGAAAIIAFLLIALGRGVGGSSAGNAAGSGSASPVSAASQLPPRCTDAALRFPGLNDPRAAVAAGYRENGVDVDLPRPGGARLTPDQAEQVMGGWMAISLLMERSGQPPPTLASWLDSETDRPTLSNAILAGRRVESMVTAEEWATMRGWPATTCEGAFLIDPRNAAAVRMIERVVAR